MKEKILQKINTQSINYLYIDKVQSLSSDHMFKNRKDELRYIMKDLKLFSIKYQFSLIISSSFRGSADKCAAQLHKISQLKNYDILEEFSDLILFLYKSRGYYILEGEKRKKRKGDLQFLTAKNRYGKLFSAIVHYDSKVPCIKDIGFGVFIE